MIYELSPLLNTKQQFVVFANGSLVMPRDYMSNVPRGVFKFRQEFRGMLKAIHL